MIRFLRNFTIYIAVFIIILPLFMCLLITHSILQSLSFLCEKITEQIERLAKTLNNLCDYKND